MPAVIANRSIRPQGPDHVLITFVLARPLPMQEVEALTRETSTAPSIAVRSVEATPGSVKLLAGPIDPQLVSLEAAMQVLERREGLDRAKLAFALVHGIAAAFSELGGVHGRFSASLTFLDPRGALHLLGGGSDRINTLLAPHVDPGTVAPEILRGGAPSERSDVYSVGAFLSRVLTGQIRSGLAAVLNRALSPRPEDRWASVQNFCSAMDATLAASDPALRDPSRTLTKLHQALSKVLPQGAKALFSSAAQSRLSSFPAAAFAEDMAPATDDLRIEEPPRVSEQRMAFVAVGFLALSVAAVLALWIFL